jgi:ribosomal protein S27E
VNTYTQTPQRNLIGSGVKRYQTAGSTCPDCGGEEWCYSDSHPTYVRDELSARRAPSVKALVRHMESHMADWCLKEDFHDCVLPLAKPEDRKQLTAYYELRRKSPTFKPGLRGHNNHKLVDADKLGAILDHAQDTAVCEGCGKDFIVHRKTARFCGAACRKRANRVQDLGKSAQEAESA